MSVQAKSHRVLIRTKRLDSWQERVDGAIGVMASASRYAGGFIKLNRVASRMTVAVEEVQRMVRRLNRESTIFRRTGGTHSAGIFHDGEMFTFAEDISRHNALDKAIGAAAENGVDSRGASLSLQVDNPQV